MKRIDIKYILYILLSLSILFIIHYSYILVFQKVKPEYGGYTTAQITTITMTGYVLIGLLVICDAVLGIIYAYMKKRDSFLKSINLGGLLIGIMSGVIFLLISLIWFRLIYEKKITISTLSLNAGTILFAVITGTSIIMFVSTISGVVGAAIGYRLNHRNK